MSEYKPTKPPIIPPTVAPTAPPTIPPTVAPTAPPTIPPTMPPTLPPTIPPTAPPCQSKVFWVVEPGDTIYVIAKTSGTTVTKLLELNPQINPNSLLAGQRICLPG